MRSLEMLQNEGMGNSKYGVNSFAPLTVPDKTHLKNLL
jgi:hypothetical protein